MQTAKDFCETLGEWAFYGAVFLMVTGMLMTLACVLMELYLWAKGQ